MESSETKLETLPQAALRVAAAVDRLDLPRRRPSSFSARLDLRLRLRPKGTTVVPLDGAARGSGLTRAPARGATAEPPSPVSRPLQALGCALLLAGMRERKGR